jgi:imidazolonepropionase-like amidohydrolase
MVRNFWLSLFAAAVFSLPAFADDLTLLRPDRVFTAEDNAVHPGWEVLVEGNLIKAVGPALDTPNGSRIVRLPGATLLPGLMDIHSHLFLHPYNEKSWDDQVLKEAFAYRVLLATAHARATLGAGSQPFATLGRKAPSTVMSISSERSMTELCLGHVFTS